MEVVVERIASRLNLYSYQGKEWHGANPFEQGATQNGFILFPEGNAYDRKIEKRYTFKEISTLLSNGFKARPAADLKAKTSRGHAKKPKKKEFDWDNSVVTEYLYTLNGENHVKILRYDDFTKNEKTFVQKHYENGRWVTGKSKVEVPYNESQVSIAKYIVVVEGEKCADVLQGHIETGDYKNIMAATTNAGGTANTKAYEQISKFLVGKRVAIIPDNDSVGQRHAERVAKYCSESERVRVLPLLGLGPAEDVYDWIKRGNNPAILFRHIQLRLIR